MTVQDQDHTHTGDGAGLTALITTIYRETLTDGTLDADSDFFEAGGDSLVAFQITARLQEELGADLPVALIFSYPSPADLAGVVDAELASLADRAR